MTETRRLWMGLLGKEWRQAWRSFRIGAVWLTLLVFAVSDPLLSRHMDALLRLAGPEIRIALPEPTPEMAFGQFLGDVPIALLVLVLVSAPAVAAERREGVTAWLLARPVPRGAYLGAKLSVLLLGAVAGIAGASALSWMYTWSLFGRAPALEASVAASLAAVVLGVLVVSVTFTASALARSSGVASGVGLAAYALLLAGSALLGPAPWARWLPTALVTRATTLPPPGAGVAAVAPAALATLALAAALLAWGFWAFRRAQVAP